MSIFKQPFRILLFMLMVFCCLFITKQGLNISRNDKISTYEDLGVQTFTPRTINKVYKKTASAVHRGRTLNTQTTRYQLKYVSTKGYIYRDERATMEAALALKSKGAIERRILRNNQEKTYITIDGQLTKEQYMYERLFDLIQRLGYWVVVLLLLIFGAFKFGVVRLGRSAA